MTHPHFAFRVCAAVLLCTRLTSAQSSLSLQWIAPADCPPAHEVRRMALRGMGSEPAPGSLLEAEAEVRRVEVDGVQRYRVELRTRRGEERGERSIDAATCGGVAEATALVLSLALAAPPAASDDENKAGATPEEAAPRAAAPAAREPEAVESATVRAAEAPAAFEAPASAGAGDSDRRIRASAQQSPAATKPAPAQRQRLAGRTLLPLAHARWRSASLYPAISQRSRSQQLAAGSAWRGTAGACGSSSKPVGGCPNLEQSMHSPQAHASR